MAMGWLSGKRNAEASSAPMEDPASIDEMGPGNCYFL